MPPQKGLFGDAHSRMNVIHADAGLKVRATTLRVKGTTSDRPERGDVAPWREKDGRSLENLKRTGQFLPETNRGETEGFGFSLHSLSLPPVNGRIEGLIPFHSVRPGNSRRPAATENLPPPACPLMLILVKNSLPLLLLALLGTAVAGAQDAAAPAAPSPAAPAQAPRLPPDTHGVDMRTQAGPPGARYSPPSPPDNKLPTFWLIGDSTVRNGSAGDGTNLNQWGWGAPLTFYFDPQKVNVVNRALGGTSARSFYNANWKNMVGLIKPGDTLIMQFGTNDAGDIPGIGDETKDVTGRSGQHEVLHTYGWYLRQIIAETRAKGATPIVCSLIPRKAWDDNGHIKRTMDTFEGWAGQVARAEHVGFIDLNELIARRYDVMGKEKVDLIYVPNPTPDKPKGETVHTGWEGAVLNAEVVVSGLKALKDDPVAAYFSEKARAIAPASP